MKPLRFIDNSLNTLRAMPIDARQALGIELMVVQHGGMPSDFKSMTTVGPGAYEIRHKDETGVFRVIYVAKFANAVYVLHAFQKKTRKTSKTDINLAATRYRKLLEKIK